MTKIVMVCYKYPPAYSGYGNQANTVNKKLIDTNSDYTFKIITGKFMEKSKMNHKNMDIILLGLKSKKNKINSALQFYSYSVATFFWILTNKRNVDVIHVIKAGPEAAAAIIAGKLIQRPVIVKIAQDELSNNEKQAGFLLNRSLRKMRNKILTMADIYIAISGGIYSRLLNKGVSKEKIYKIPNGVDNNRFKKVSSLQKKNFRKELNINSEELVIMFSGSISVRKGIFDLLNALEDFHPTRLVRVLICGPIYEKESKFFAQIKRINNNNKLIVDYRGKVNNIENFIQAADIFILPSYSEGLPNVLLEAGSVGNGLIASDISGNNDVIDNGVNGLLFPAGNIEMLREQLMLLIENSELREEFQKSIYEKCKDKYTIEKVSNKYGDLYKSLSSYGTKHNE